MTSSDCHFSNTRCRREAIEGLENLALSFLSQLANAFRPEKSAQSTSELKPNKSVQKKVKKRIVLELANRRALADGYVSCDDPDWIQCKCLFQERRAEICLLPAEHQRVMCEGAW